MIAREYHNQKKYERVPKLKRIPRSITIKMTAREDSKIVLSGIIIIKTTAQTKVLPVNATIKGIPRSIIIKATARECQIQNDDRECINQKNCH